MATRAFNTQTLSQRLRPTGTTDIIPDAPPWAAGDLVGRASGRHRKPVRRRRSLPLRQRLRLPRPSFLFPAVFTDRAVSFTTPRAPVWRASFDIRILFEISTACWISPPRTWEPLASVVVGTGTTAAGAEALPERERSAPAPAGFR